MTMVSLSIYMPGRRNIGHKSTFNHFWAALEKQGNEAPVFLTCTVNVQKAFSYYANHLLENK